MIQKYIPFLLVFTLLLVGCSEDEPNLEELVIPEAQVCESTHPLVGQSKQLRVSNTYGISGTVTIMSDCEIQFSDFFYNGLGPAVSIYGGLNSDFDSGINLSTTLNGRRFTGDTFSVFLPEGTTLDDINSFSVWCFQFDINFSSVSFQ